MTTRTKGLIERYPESLIEINPVDADKLGVAEDQKIKVTSRRGTVEAKASITKKSVPGSIFIMTPAKSKRSAARSAGGIILGAKRRRITDASVNLLTNPALDPIGKISEYKVCAVKVEAA
jgi:formate dehydrogenase major subunit